MQKLKSTHSIKPCYLIYFNDEAEPIIPADRLRRPLNSNVCAGHGALLHRWKSYG